jgi:SAM-dependent MidA family methyltransferase
LLLHDERIAHRSERRHARAKRHHFLVGAATPLLKSLEALPLTPSTLKILRSLRTLLHPEIMGTQFKSILFSKNAAPAQPLSGFQHAGDCKFLFAHPQ